MAQPRVKWGQVRRYFERRGYTIRERGGDKIIVAPKGEAGVLRNTLRIGHTSTRNDGTELLRCYTSAIERVFGVSIDDILND
jgi:hypothetical protein